MSTSRLNIEEVTDYKLQRDDGHELSFAYSPGRSEVLFQLLNSFIPYETRIVKLDDTEQLDEFLYDQETLFAGIAFDDHLMVKFTTEPNSKSDLNCFIYRKLQNSRIISTTPFDCQTTSTSKAFIHLQG